MNVDLTLRSHGSVRQLRLGRADMGRGLTLKAQRPQAGTRYPGTNQTLKGRELVQAESCWHGS